MTARSDPAPATRWPIPDLTPPRLGENEAHVWRVRVSAWAPLIPQLGASLDHDEQGRAARFHFDRDRQQFVVAHGVLRALLGRYAERPPRELRFTVGAAGKPALVMPQGSPPLQFNMSHSADLILVGVSRTAAIGIDVEQWSRDVELEQVATHFFSTLECAALAALAPDDRTAGFFSCWSRKEAYIKATGLGVSNGLDHFDVAISPGGGAALLADRSTPEARERWRMFYLAVDPDYSAAVVVESSVSIVNTYTAEPSALGPGTRGQ